MPATGQSGESAPLIFREVSKYFSGRQGKVAALDAVTLEAKRGKVTGLIGPDGAGKTTLMRLAAGLLLRDGGTINVLDCDPSKKSPAESSNLGYMPQRFGLYEDLTVQENLDLYADLRGTPVAERPQRYAELMRMTGLGNFKKRLAGRLSGGMKQKLGLACTLVRSPKLLLLDEPTVGVDPLSRRELWDIVYRLAQEGTTVLLSTSYLDEAERCDEVVMLYEGKVFGVGLPASFSERVQGRVFAFHSPRLDRRALLSSVSAHPEVTDAVIQGYRLRVVMQRGVEPDPERLFPEVEGLSISSIPARFEDDFIAELRDRGAKTETHVPSSPGAAHKIGDTVISVKNVARKFGDFYAVKGVSFDVRRGEVFGLLGANGAGKTTTFRMLCGLLPVSAGDASVAGVDLRHSAAKARARIGYMSQKFSLYGQLSSRDNLDFFSSAYGLSGKKRRDRIQWVLEEFGLGPHADEQCHQLPLGFKQRLALGCALMHDPEVLFLDEPTSGVDPIARREFWARINDLAGRGVTVLVTTHFMAEAEYCDRLAIMAMGELLDIGSPEEIRLKARTAEQPEPTMEEAFIHLIEKPKGEG